MWGKLEQWLGTSMFLQLGVKIFQILKKSPWKAGIFPDQYPQETVSALFSFIINNIN